MCLCFGSFNKKKTTNQNKMKHRISFSTMKTSSCLINRANEMRNCGKYILFHLKDVILPRGISEFIWVKQLMNINFMVVFLPILSSNDSTVSQAFSAKTLSMDLSMKSVHFLLWGEILADMERVEVLAHVPSLDHSDVSNFSFVYLHLYMYGIRDQWLGNWSKFGLLVWWMKSRNRMPVHSIPAY